MDIVPRLSPPNTHLKKEVCCSIPDNNYRAHSFLLIDQLTKIQCVTADSLRPSQQFFSHVGKGLPGLKTVLSIG